MLLSAPVLDSAPVTARCAECLEEFPHDELMPFSGFFVCSQCKPDAVRKLGSGMPIGRMWRKKGLLIVAVKDAVFPSRCVKCNELTGDERMRRKIHWHSPLLYVLFLLNVLIYLIVAICVRKRAELNIAVC